MKVFLCWSGERSRHVAESFDRLLQHLNKELSLSVEQAFVPFRSANIEKGLPWFQAVEKELSTADAALVSITPENCTSPWMHYEAGAVANRMGLAMSGNDATSTETLKGRLFTYLFGIRAGDLRGPLAAYQSTTATYEDTRALVRRLLAIAGVEWPTDEQASDSRQWERVFRSCWNHFVEDLRPCRHQQVGDLIPDFSHKFQRLTFKEPVALCHRQAWTDRVKGCHQVLTDLQCRLDEVRERCRPFQTDLYQELLTALDGYEMTMQAYLVADKPFDLGPEGKLKMGNDTEWVCENRRHIVLQAVCKLLDPQTAPVFDESASFAVLETFPEKKNAIHRKAAEIRRFLLEQNEAAMPQADLLLNNIKIAELDIAPALPAKADFERAVQSSWDFDRAIYYLTHAESIRVGLLPEVAKRHGIYTGSELKEALPRWLGEEVENIRARRRLPMPNQQQTSLSGSEDRVVESAEARSPNQSAPEPSRVPLSYALSVLLELVHSWEASGRPPEDGNLESYRPLLNEIIDLELGLESQVRARAKLILDKMEPLRKSATAR